MLICRFAYAFVAALPSLVIMSPAHAAGDYRLDSREWNGLAQLDEEARNLGCPLRAEQRLDWATLDGHDVLWFVYPRTPIDPNKLRRFLEAGGRVVIADDFGASDAALATLQIRRLRGDLSEAEHYEDNQALPVARLSLATELSVGVAELVANHPAFFSTAVPATYAFAPGAALVVEGRLGKGYFVAIADPSVLINNMLELPDDLDFARALIKRTCRPSEDRIRLYTQRFSSVGEPAGDWVTGDEGSLVSRFNRMLGNMNDSAANALASTLDGALPTLLAIALSLYAVWLFFRAWPGKNRVDGQWTRAPSAYETGWQAHLDRYAAASPPRNLALPAMVLREEVMARLAEALEDAAVGGWTPAELSRRLAVAHGTAAANAAAELWKRLRKLGWRGATPTVEPSVSRRQLEQLAELARELFDALDARRQAG
jgi:hypothetical protein